MFGSHGDLWIYDQMSTGNKAVVEATRRTLVRKDVFCFVSQLVQIGQTGILYHRWRTTQDDEDIAGRSRQVLLDHVIGHES